MPKYPEVIVKKSEFVTNNSVSVVGICIFHLKRYMNGQKWGFKKLDAEITRFVIGTKDLNYNECIEYARTWVTIVE